MFKNILVFFFLFIGIAASTAQNTYTVSNGDDSGPGSLRKAIQDANASPGADNIIFSGNFQVNLTSAELNITDPVTITGNGMTSTIIDGGFNVRLFSLTTTAGPSTFSNLTMQNGKSPANGGGGAVAGGSINLTFNNIKFLNNSTSADGLLFRTDGGAISVSSSGILTVNSCIFDGNKVLRGTAPNDGGCFGGAISIVGNVTADIKNSTFTNNISEGGLTNIPGPGNTPSGGGAIYSSGTSCTITDCSFSYNKVSYSVAGQNFIDLNGNGGAILCTGPLVLKGSLSFTNNASGGSGGAIYKNNSGWFNVAAVTSLDMIGNRGAVSNVTNIAGNGGGAIYTAASLSLNAANNATLNDNAAFGHGGAIYSVGPLSLDNIKSITNNSATMGGGALNSAALTLKDMTISGNKAGYNPDTKTYAVPSGGYGGGAVSAGGTLTLIGKIVFQRDTAAGYGGAMYRSSNGAFDASQLKSWIISDNTTMFGNSTNTHGGGIYTRGDINVSTADSVVFRNNVSTSNGGGIYVVTGFNVSLTNALITANSCSGVGSGLAGGGGVYVQSPAGTFTLENSTVSYNKAGYNPSSGSFNTLGVGGGINALGPLTLKGNVVIKNNQAAVNGGGIYKGGATSLTVGGLTSFTLTQNTAYGAGTNSGRGGGIYTESPLTLTNANGAVITNNLAMGDGGGIYSSVSAGAADITLNNINLISNNAATVNGGAVYASGPLTLNNMTVSNNKAGYNSETNAYSNQSGGGGGVYAGDALTLTGTIVFQKDTIAGNGGAIYKAAPGTFSTTGLTSFTMSQNKSQLSLGSVASGGGIYTLAPLSLSASNGASITNNYSETNGGAIYANDSLTIKYLSILNNTSLGSGGAVYLGSAGKMLSSSNTYANNSCPAAFGSGGAIAMAPSASATILNNTFSNNSSLKTDGGAIYMPGGAGSSLKIAFSTFNGNFAMSGNGQAIYMGTLGARVLNGNIIYGNGNPGTPEIVFGGALNSSYNVVRGTAVLPTSTGNVNVPAGQATQIFTTVSSGDQATLANNGGPTQTLRILKSSYAYNLVPVSKVSAWSSDFGTISYDQRDSARLSGCQYDAGSVEIYGPDDPVTTLLKKQTVCPNSVIDADTLILSTVNIVDTLYYKDAQCTLPFAMPTTITNSTNIYVKFTSTSHCESIDTIRVKAFPKETTWINTGEMSNWNDSLNWDRGIPGPCTNVIIPAGQPTYPILKTADVNYIHPVCDTITFKFGGEVAKTHFLNYNFARVDLTLNPNRWYMLSPALRQQYSGDYQEAGSVARLNPQIFIMYYQTANPQIDAGKVAAKFTGFFNNTDELLQMTTGHAVWVDNGTRTDPNFTIHFPKDSTQYAYYDQDNHSVVKMSDLMTKDKRGRFIYEGNATYQPNSDGSFSQAMDNSNAYPQLIIGNPFMSHLDIVKFQNMNNAYLAKSFRLWKNGTNYESYLINGDGTVTSTDGAGATGFMIPPMQSFIIDTKLMFTAPLTFTTDMSITRPGSTLRSSETSEDHFASNVLRLEVLQKGVRQSGIALRYMKGASAHFEKEKDVWTVIPQSIGNYVSLYMLVDNGATSIHTTEKISDPIDLGISVGSTIRKAVASGVYEPYTIQIAGSDMQLNGRTIYLRDLADNTTHNLSQSPYTFTNTTGNVLGRFQLFAGSTTTAIQEATSDNNNIRISSHSDRQVRIESVSGDPIREVQVYTLVGQQLYHETGLNTSARTFDLPGKDQILIVKVKTEKDDKTQKIQLQ